MRLVVENTKMIKGLFNIIGKTNPECKLYFNKESIKARVNEPSNVAMMDIEITSRAFNKYDCNTEEAIIINMSELNTILSKVKETDILIIESTKAELMITTKGRYFKTYNVRIMDSESEENQWDSSRFKHTCSVTTDSSLFSEGISDLSIVSDSIQLKCSESGFELVGFDDRGAEKGTVNLSKGTDKNTSYKFIEVETKVKEAGVEVVKKALATEAVGKFAQSFMANILNAKSLSAMMRIRWMTNGPVELYYNVPDRFKINYYQAPRVEND